MAAEKGRLTHALGAESAEVAGHFAAAHGKADERHIAQLQLRQHYLQIPGEGVVVVAGGGLAGLAGTPGGHR